MFIVYLPVAVSVTLATLKESAAAGVPVPVRCIQHLHNPCCILVVFVPPSAIIVALPADPLTIAVAPIFVVVGSVTVVAVVLPLI